MAVSGHAGAAKRGEDLICAGASMLARTAEQIALDVCGVLADVTDGRMTLECKPDTDESYEYLLHAFLTVRTGFEVLAKNFPQYVRVETG
jgi:uncharacterized protein YsxB (DUF464 family)